MKLLAILPRFPYPLEKGDKLRAYHLLKGLSRHHDIYLFALTDQPVKRSHLQEVASFCAGVEVYRQRWSGIAWHMLTSWLQGWPLQMGYYYHPNALRQLRQFTERVQPDQLYFQLLRTARYAKALPDLPKTLDYMDAFAAGMQRRAKNTKGPTRWIWQIEYQRLKQQEEAVFHWFDRHTVITKQDQQLIHHPDKEQIKVVSNGIDLHYFQLPNPSPEKDVDILFAGNMSYAPNVRAAQFIAEKVVPLLRPAFPQLRVALVGTDPHPQVKQLAGKGVEVTGWVENIAYWYARSKVMFAPMEIGAGLQNKLLEAMALKLPCVTSPMAREAMDSATHDFVPVAEEPEKYATVLADLLEDAAKRKALGEAGYHYVTRHHDWDAISERLHHYLTGSSPTAAP